jgi:uncharacterized membrane protein YbhN (UPF0104 family)
MAETNVAVPAEAAGTGPSILRRGLRLFSSPSGERRYRRATDVLLLVPALVGLGILIAVYPPKRFERSLISLLDSVPGWLDPVWIFFYDLLAIWAIVLLVAAVVARRSFVTLQALAALALAIGAALVSARLALGHWPDLADAVRGGSGSPGFPGIRLAQAAAVVLTIGPDLVRPFQKIGHWVFWLGFAGAMLIGPATPSGNLAGVLIAILAASAARLAFGTSAGRVGLPEVAAGLAELGVSAEQLAMADRQVAGVVVVQGRDPEGRHLLVKVHGRDAYDNQLLEKFWRLLWYQDPGPRLGLSRLQVAEHEAFATLLARNEGVPSYDVVRAGMTTRDDALLVLRGDPRPLDSLPPEDVTDDALATSWQSLALLRRANIAHRRIDTTTVALLEEDVGLIDLRAATVTPTADQLLTDRAQLLVATAVAAGPDRALKAAVESLGVDGVASLLPYLQSAALGGELRRQTKAAELDIDELRKQAASAVDVKEPELVRVRRVTWGTIIQIALLALAAWAVFSFATGIDWDEVASGLAEASWGWIVLGFVVAQLPRLTQAVATLGSVAADFRFGPVYAMQLATNYMNLALPSYAGRLAVNIRFFQRQGLPPAAAVTSGAIDSFTSTVVQIVLLALLLIFTELDLNLNLQEPSDGGSWSLVFIILGLLVLTVLVVGLVPRIRRGLVSRVRTWWPQVRAALSALRASNKLVYLLLGNVATEILFATALGLFALGLGTHVSLAQLLVINMSVSLFASFIPVPGGIGVTEFGLTVGLTSAGMTEEAALAAVLLYRISTFYLPPIWGFFALRWLQRNRYL